MKSNLKIAIACLLLSSKVNGQCWLQTNAGTYYTVAIKSDSTLWAWGWNDQGQLGNGTNTEQISPVQIGTQTDWKQVSAGRNYTEAIKNNGTLWAWGGNYDGALGIGPTPYGTYIPIQIGNATNWKQVAAGLGNTLAIKTNGTLWTWGDGFVYPSDTPKQISTASDWQYVATNLDHALMIQSNGTLWALGYNWYH